ncbi:phage polarity suppression protein [Escherichia coli]|uniref:phage polarity suppression protein n=1 Tax=Escherichia coli TaxID=562 RepID=UPI003EEB4461
MTTLTLQQAYDACQTNKTAWLNRKAELTAAEQEYQELLLDDNASGSRRLQTLRDLIDAQKMGGQSGRRCATSSRMRRCSASASVTGCVILCSRTAQS